MGADDDEDAPVPEDAGAEVARDWSAEGLPDQNVARESTVADVAAAPNSSDYPPGLLLQAAPSTQHLPQVQGDVPLQTGLGGAEARGSTVADSVSKVYGSTVADVTNALPTSTFQQPQLQSQHFSGYGPQPGPVMENVLVWYEKRIKKLNSMWVGV